MAAHSYLVQLQNCRRSFPTGSLAAQIRPEGYALATLREHDHTYWLIAGADPRGVLYGAFRLLQEIAEQHDLRSLAIERVASRAGAMG